MPPSILTLNSGSSSIRFALHEAAHPEHRLLEGIVERIGSSGTSLSWRVRGTPAPEPLPLPSPDPPAAIPFLLDWLEAHPAFASVSAIGHRVVHGMDHAGPALVTPELLKELRHTSRLDPAHLPAEIELIEALRDRHPALPQIACFDTSFHHTLPRIARQLPIPRHFEAEGLRRYGFHGLSYASLMDQLVRLEPAAATGRVILAHLGSGCSLCAVRGGQSVDTTMGFTPTGGLVMGTRSGDLDPGLITYLLGAGGMTPTTFQHMINRQSGLLGLSETSADLRDLLAREATDVRAAEAIALFCYQTSKWIGSFAAALGGLDTLVFAGGIGSHSPTIRSRICQDLGFLGILLESSPNAKNAPVISPTAARVKVRVLITDEALVLALGVQQEISNLKSQI